MPLLELMSCVGTTALPRSMSNLENTGEYAPSVALAPLKSGGLMAVNATEPMTEEKVTSDTATYLPKKVNSR